MVRPRRNSSVTDVELAALDDVDLHAQPQQVLANDRNSASDPSTATRPHLVFRRERNGWAAAKIVIRSFGSLFSAVVISINISFGVDWNWDRVDLVMVLTLPVCGSALLWDIAEYITLCARRGNGITAKAHIGLELTLFLGFLACTGLLFWFLVDDNLGYTWQSYLQSRMWGLAVLMVLLCIVHFILFVRACVDRHRRHKTAKIMYLPSGHPVVVVPQAVATELAKSKDAVAAAAAIVEEATAKNPAAAAPIINAARVPPPPFVPWDQRPPPPPPKDAWPAPPPEDYVPDESERRRGERGDAQPQWMTLEHHYGFGTSVQGDVKYYNPGQATIDQQPQLVQQPSQTLPQAHEYEPTLLAPLVQSLAPNNGPITSRGLTRKPVPNRAGSLPLAPSADLQRR